MSSWRWPPSRPLVPLSQRRTPWPPSRTALPAWRASPPPGQPSSPSPPQTAPPFARLSQQELPVQERILEVLQEPGAVGTVGDPVIHRQRNRYDAPGDPLAVAPLRNRPDTPDGQDRCLRGIDDGIEGVDAHHPEVGDREGATRELLQRQPVIPRSLHEVLDPGDELPQRERVRLEQDGYD